MTLSATLKRVAKTYQTSAKPIWEGPSGEGPNGGVTYSLLSRYLADRERFRLMAIEGIKPADGFSHRLEFGNMWHVCEKAAGEGKEWQTPLLTYAKVLCHRYRLDQDSIDIWHGICKVEFPIYLKYWQEHKDEKERTPLLQEQVFDVPYGLPGGRKVRLRGKWDGVDLIGKGKEAGVYLLEHKTKSDPNEQQIKRQLSFDLQTMTYAISCYQNYPEWMSKSLNVPLIKKCYSGKADLLMRGVRYNVIKRPRQYQGEKESKAQFLERLDGIIRASPQKFFQRYRSEVSANDVARFKRECLDPVLENLCDDYEWWGLCKAEARDPFDYSMRYDSFPEHRNRHYREPYGVYDPLAEGRPSDMDEHLATGSMVGMERVLNLFQELGAA